MNAALCLLLAFSFPSGAFGWSIGQSRIIVSKDDFKSSVPLTTSDMMDWIPWHQGEVVVSEQDSPNSHILDEHIASEYRKWAKYYDKQPDPVHFQAFKQNYLDLLSEAEEGHGGQPFFHLNQYGDMTQEEHKREMLMLEAYYNWCQEYNKPQDPRKFDAFKYNLLQAVSQMDGSNWNQDIQLGAFADCLPHSKNHCIEPLGGYNSNHNGEHFLPTTNHVQEIGNGVYIEEETTNNNNSQYHQNRQLDQHHDHDHQDDNSEILPNFLDPMHHQFWEERARSPYSGLHP